MENTLVKYIVELIQRTKANELLWLRRSISTYAVDINKDGRKARVVLQKIDNGRDEYEIQFRVFDMTMKNKVIDLSTAERPDLKAPLVKLFQTIKDGEDGRGADFLKSVLS